MLENIPSVIYKYRDWSDKNHKNILRKREVYFAAPPDLNDPFDVAIPLSYDEMDEYHWKRHFEWIIKTGRKYHSTNMSNKEIKLRVESMLKEGLHRDKAYVEQIKKRQLSSLHKDAGIFSTSITKTNIPMWSHYANNHEGFCIGFNSQLFQEDLNCMIGHVKYQDDNEIPVLIPNDIEPIKDFVGQLSYKSNDWITEEEIRLVRGGYENGSLRVENIKPLTIVEIIFGCRMPKKHKKSILKFIKTDLELSHVKCYQTIQSKTHFKLLFKKIN